MKQGFILIFTLLFSFLFFACSNDEEPERHRHRMGQPVKPMEWDIISNPNNLEVESLDKYNYLMKVDSPCSIEFECSNYSRILLSDVNEIKITEINQSDSINYKWLEIIIDKNKVNYKITQPNETELDTEVIMAIIFEDFNFASCYFYFKWEGNKL